MSGMYPDDKSLQMYGTEVVFPGMKNGKFTNGDFNDPLVPPSFIPAETVNLLLDNLNNLISALGETPNNTAANQLSLLFTSNLVTKKAICRDVSGFAQVTSPVWNDSTTKIATMAAVKEAIKNYVFPIGVCYTQYPGMSDPATLFASLGFGSMWTEQFNTEGITFRTPGGNASAFEAGIQEDAFKSHAHSACSGNNSVDHAHKGKTKGMTRANPHSHSNNAQYAGISAGDTSRPFLNINGVISYNATNIVNTTDINHEHEFTTGGVSDNHAHTITVDQSGGSETRMRNRTFRVWKRTA